MTAKLAVGVAVRHPDTGAAVFLRAGSVPPAWARLGGHVYADDDTPAPAPRPAPEQDPVSGVAEPPPRYGRGSSAAAWRDWADQAGVDLTEYGPDATRDQVIAAASRAEVLDNE